LRAWKTARWIPTSKGRRDGHQADFKRAGRQPFPLLNANVLAISAKSCYKEQDRIVMKAI
jgi:hypothetical protein